MTERGPSRYIWPNALTIARPFIAKEASKAIKEGQKGKALTLLSLAALTDADGTVARRLNATSRFGEIADPIADGAMRFLVFKELEMAKGTKAIKIIAESAIIITNLSLFVLSKIDDSIKPPSARPLAKIRFNVDAVGSARLITNPRDKIASWAIAGMSVLTAIDYINSARKSLRRPPKTTGAVLNRLL